MLRTGPAPTRPGPSRGSDRERRASVRQSCSASRPGATAARGARGSGGSGRRRPAEAREGRGPRRPRACGAADLGPRTFVQPSGCGSGRHPVSQENGGRGERDPRTRGDCRERSTSHRAPNERASRIRPLARVETARFPGLRGGGTPARHPRKFRPNPSRFTSHAASGRAMNYRHAHDESVPRPLVARRRPRGARARARVDVRANAGRVNSPGAGRARPPNRARNRGGASASRRHRGCPLGARPRGGRNARRFALRSAFSHERADPGSVPLAGPLRQSCRRWVVDLLPNETIATARRNLRGGERIEQGDNGRHRRGARRGGEEGRRAATKAAHLHPARHGSRARSREPVRRDRARSGEKQRRAIERPRAPRALDRQPRNRRAGASARIPRRIRAPGRKWPTRSSKTPAPRFR